jgi:RHS repeat-associated protein
MFNRPIITKMSVNNYIFILLGTTTFMISRQAAAQTNPGFVQQDIIKVEHITTDAQTYGLSTAGKQTTRAYYDGFGRTLQTVAVGASPQNNDMIQPVAYDNLGRQTVSYLPYTGLSSDTAGNYRGNAISTAQAAFYNQASQYVIATDAAPYTQQVFENSPLQRLLQAGTVGNGFQPLSGQHYKTVSYRYNKSTDGNILIWNPDGTFTSNNFYAANTLTVTDGKDEDNTETLTFTDLAGRIILKRQILIDDDLDTYYIYNNAGMPAYIVPPQATLLLAANSYNLLAAPLSNLVFKFTYDTMGRLVEKTVPAKGTVYVVYDPMNRPVLLQDANMLANNQWNYIKYDAKGRAAGQGIYTDATSGHNGRINMQAFVNTLASSYNSAWYETRSTSSLNGGYYTNNIFPTGTYGTLTALAYSYFDDYNLTGSPNFTYANQGLTGEIGATGAAVKGMPTVISKTTVGAGITSGTWLTTVIFYDRRGNPVQTQSNSQLNYTNATTVPDIKTTVPDFTGVPLINKVSKTASGTTVTVQTNFTYDQVYRVQTITQSYNGSTAATIATYYYNELGQVIKKGLGLNAGVYLQNVDMRYNIRGQLLSINNSKLTSDGGITNSDGNDVFGMQFLYDQTDTNLGNTAYYNGKLSAVKWMSGNGSGSNTYERAYKYSYDQINRYTAASYAERATSSTSTFSNNIGGFDESGITYDFNGNILTLNRNSSTQGTNSNVQIDNLTYGYSTTNPNQLLTVTDGTDANHTGAGFRNYTGSTGSYTYDANGNLTADPYKGITSIQYNVLNRVDNMTLTYNATGRYIKYTYDAGGTLIRKQSYDNNTLGTTTDYIDGFVYTTSGAGTAALTYFPMPEGRVLYASGTFTKEFVITDQQGNARVSFNNTGTGGTVHVVQEDSYYGFGMVMNGSTTGGDNRQLYNGGSEWQNDYQNLPDYYQTFYRNYDATLGRFIGVDPKAESAESMTGYQYSGNNPIMYNDPLGDLLRTPPGVNGPSIVTESNYSSPNLNNSFSDDYGYGEDGESGFGGDGSTDYSMQWDEILATNGYGGHINSDGTVSAIAPMRSSNDAGPTLDKSTASAAMSGQKNGYQWMGVSNVDYSLNVNQGGDWDYLGEKSFGFKKINSNWRGARVTDLTFSVEDVQANRTYSSKFSIEVGVPIKSKNGTFYSAKDAVYYATLTANVVAVQASWVAKFMGPGGREMMVNDATLPYLFAAQMQMKLNQYIPGATVTANTFQYNVTERQAVWVNFFQHFKEGLGL